MDILHPLGAYLPYMAGLKQAYVSYNMLGIWMYVGQTKQFLGPHTNTEDQKTCVL